MNGIKIFIEIGHESSLKAKPTPDGFTHDWQLFVRSCHSNDISHFIDKVVFNLHESFAKPKRGEFHIVLSALLTIHYTPRPLLTCSH